MTKTATGRWTTATALMALGALLFLHGAARAASVAEILAEAAESCAASGGTAFEHGDAVAEVDLDGVAPSDRLVDTGRFTCAGAPSGYCGSGGCTLLAVVGEESWRFQAEDWRMIDWDGRPVLLIARDGGWCGGAGSQQCVEAVVWSAGQPLSVKTAR
ncbi:hypothetical protein [Frigidibacter sp. MR17.24]|uniref:hypothetical protein n=1 Tax=Frigidibacter sp. MR17.24 TaxID=3127345 RepID=UPI003012FDD3